jgi:tRNA A37 threonylcarbamoyladenosine synthetase subunit TsaC/SUA5/YrdC
VREQLGSRLNLIVDGGTSPREVPSTIVDLTVDELGKSCWRIQRQGAIPAKEIEEILSGK